MSATPLRVGDLIEVPAARLPNPPYLRARIISVVECADGEVVVRTDDGGQQRFYHPPF